jgi:hypothetical protein
LYFGCSGYASQNWAIFYALCHSLTASIFVSFARHSSAFSGLFQALSVIKLYYNATIMFSHMAEYCGILQQKKEDKKRMQSMPK